MSDSSPTALEIAAPTPRSGRSRSPWLIALAIGILALVYPFVVGPLLLDLAAQVFLISVGALALMLLTGFAGQVSLGHSGLLAAGAFTVGILYKEVGASPLVTLPAAAAVGGLLGLMFGLPSLRLRGLYLAVSTLALHFVVIYLTGEYETVRGYSTGILIPPGKVLGWAIQGAITWYFILLVAMLLCWLLCRNILASRTGRAWGAIHANETVAAALGIPVARYKLLAFVISASITAVCGALFAYHRGFVSVEAFSLYLSIQFVAMIIIGGMGSLGGAVLGAIFVTLFPYAIEAVMLRVLGAGGFAASAFALNYAVFGAVMILFLMYEPQGLIGIARRLRQLLSPRGARR